MTVETKDFCKKHGLTEGQFYGREKYEGYLYLGSLTSIPDTFNPTVGGSLDLRSLTSIPDTFNPTVGGSLYLRSLTSIPDTFNPTVGGYLDLGSLTSIPDTFNPTVGGSLDLRSLTSIPDTFNPTVGGSLYLRSLTSIPDTFNPTVGGYLDLGSLTSIPDTFNPTVGGSLYLGSGLVANHTPLNNRLLSWQGGKYVAADGICTEVLSKKGRVFTVKKIGSEKISYLVSDGKTHAHGETVEQARSDYRFKLIAAKLKNDPIKADTIITIPYYRAVTGACEFGVRQWVDSVFSEKEKATILKNGIKAVDLLPLLKKNSAFGLGKFESLLAF